MLPGEITSVGCIFLCSSVVTPLPSCGLSRLLTSPPLQGPFFSLTCRCQIGCCGAPGRHLLPESPSMACTSFLYILDILAPAPILHHSGISTLFSPQSIVPKTMLQCGSLHLPHVWPYPESRRNITNIYCLPWTNMHYPHTGLSVYWTPNRISGLWTGGSKILTEETSNENAPAVFWQDAVLLWERTIGQEDKSQLRGDWTSFLQVTYLAFNLWTVV